MKQPELFDEPLEPVPAPVTARKSSSKTKRIGIWTTVGMSAGLLLLIAVYFLANRQTHEPVVSLLPKESPGSSTIQVEVLNAVGGSRLAQRFTDYLRSRGFDVVDFGNTKLRNADQTYVIDRSGKAGAAQLVAEALGLPEGRVVQEIDKSLYLDVTIVVGRDHGTLNRIP